MSVVLMTDTVSLDTKTYVGMNAGKPTLSQLFQVWGLGGTFNFPDRRRKWLATFIEGESMKSMFDICRYAGVHEGIFAFPRLKQSGLGDPQRACS